MPQPQSLNTYFETFVQALPADYMAQAYEFKAFERARKIQSPQQLLQLVMLYCGLDLSQRSCAGELAHLQGYISDTGIKKTGGLCALGKVVGFGRSLPVISAISWCIIPVAK